MKTAYRIGQGFLSDSEAAEWEALGRPATAAAVVDAPRIDAAPHIEAEPDRSPAVLDETRASPVALEENAPAPVEHDRPGPGKAEG